MQSPSPPLLLPPTAAAARALVSTMEFDMSVIGDARAPCPLATTAYLLPAPEEQSAYELRLASEHWSLACRLRDAPHGALSALTSRSEYRSNATATVAGLLWNDKRRGGSPLSTATVARRFALFLNTLLADAASSLSPRMTAAGGALRLVGPDGPLGRYTRSATHAPDDPRARFAQFFRDDAFEEDKPWAAGDGVLADTDPATYAMFRAIAQTTNARTPGTGYALRGPTADIPRPDIPRLSRIALQAFHMPPRAGDRLCARGERCLFNMHPEHGHVGREFYASTPPAPGAPLGLCLNCLLAETRIEADRNVKEGIVPPLPINTFTVIVGEKDYGSHCLMRIEVDGRPTGISGPYPRFDTSLRSWQPVPESWARFYQIAGGPKNVYFWAETNMDFRQASVASTRAFPSPSHGPFSGPKTGTSSSRANSAPL